MIVIRSKCKFGNQLFQYAFGYAMSKKLNTTLLISNNIKIPFLLHRYFTISRWSVTPTFLRGILRLIARKTVKSNERFDNMTATDYTYYNGYFQSAGFFHPFEDEVKRKLQIRKKYVEQYRNKYDDLFGNNKTLVIHIRRTDYLTEFGGNCVLPVSYYKRCLAMIDDINSFKIIVIGDDMEFAKANFTDLPNVSFERNDMIIDFQLLMHADTIIMSNSTFAWWATYLNSKETKTVYAPKYFLGFKTHTEAPYGISHGLTYNWVEAGE